jgi:hypothetical protein
MRARMTSAIFFSSSVSGDSRKCAVIALGTRIFGLAKYSITIRVKSSSDMMAPYSCTNRR